MRSATERQKNSEQSTHGSASQKLRTFNYLTTASAMDSTELYQDPAAKITASTSCLSSHPRPAWEPGAGCNDPWSTGCCALAAAGLNESDAPR